MKGISKMDSISSIKEKVKKLRNSYPKWKEKYPELDNISCCPCCGGEAILQDNGFETFLEDGTKNEASSFEGDIFWVSCLDCGLAQFGYSDPVSAINNWNKRI